VGTSPLTVLAPDPSAIQHPISLNPPCRRTHHSVLRRGGPIRDPWPQQIPDRPTIQRNGSITPGDKNSDTFYEVWFGAAKARKVLVPVNWRLAPAEIAYILNDSGAEFLFVGPEFFAVIDQIRHQLSTIKRIVGLSGTHPECESYVGWRDRQADADSCLINSPDDVAIQLYTSGTTGHPKGVQLTHANVFAAIEAAPEWYPCGADDVSLACMPQFHIAGSILGLFSLYRGARTVIMRETALAEILRLIPGERVTLTFLVPSLLLFMLQTAGCEDVDFSSLRRIVYGASPIAVDVLRAALATFKCDFCHLYGLTETTGVVTCTRPDRRDRRAFTSEHARLLEPAGGNRDDDPGRLATHGRRRLCRPRRLLVYPRSH
jgi:acyl-CoA synthetase (AMP-forming)/AMP-acid ligase II